MCDLSALSSTLLSDSFLRRVNTPVHVDTPVRPVDTPVHPVDTLVHISADSFRSCCNAALPTSGEELEVAATGHCAVDMRGLLLSLLEVASALSYLHRMGICVTSRCVRIVHCDVKVRGLRGPAGTAVRLVSTRAVLFGLVFFSRVV